MDSTDFRLEGKRSVSRKDPSWSYKCNSPGRRYQVLSDAQRRIRKVWGGYSPKVYDGTFLEMWKEWIETNLRGGVVVADNHYEYGRYSIQDPKFYVAKSNPRGRKRKRQDSGQNLQVLTKEQQQMNAAIKKARSRVEAPFGTIKLMWKNLNKPFGEDPEQLDCLVFIAFAVHNLQI